MPDFMTEVVEVHKLPESIKAIVEKHEDAEFIRKTVTMPDEDWKFDEGEKAEIGFISTAGIDRDGEILVPAGCDLSEFNKSRQVLWGHDYHMPPIAKALWVKKEPKKNPKGILAKTAYADTDFANQVWQLVKGGFLKTASVGFMPTESVSSRDDNFDRVCDKLNKTGIEFDRTRVSRIYTKWILLEYSKVSVPANIDALTVAVAKGMKLPKEMLDEFGISEEQVQGASEKTELADFKAVIPFKDLGMAPESAEWDAGKEVKAASIEDMKLICTWYDSENEDIKSAYKLPHHRALGRHAAVWRGIAAAMAAVLGARGGVNIPEKDRKPGYSHLAKHYKQFGKEPPEFKDYPQAELKILFDEVWDEALYLRFPAMKPYPNEHACRLLDPDGWDSVRRQNDKFGEGIHAVYGIKDDAAKLQAIRFSKTKFTPLAARKWLEQHDYKCILFEPASESRSEEIADLKAYVEKVADPASVCVVKYPEKEIAPVIEVHRKPPKVELVEVVPEKEETVVELVEKELGRQLGRV